MAWRPRLAEQGEHEHEQDAVLSAAAPPPNSASPSSLYHPANSSREVLPILPSPIAAVDPLSPIDIGGIFTSSGGGEEGEGEGEGEREREGMSTPITSPPSVPSAPTLLKSKGKGKGR